MLTSTLDPSRLVNGLDYHGNLCGITNYITPSGDDVINLPKAYPLPSGLFVCVESCPSTNNMDEFICEYETQQEIDELLSFQAGVGALSEFSTEKSLYMFYVSQKRCMPRIESASFLGYCIPNKQLEVLLLSDSATSNATANATTVNNDTSIAVSSEMKSVSRSEAFDIVMADVHTVRYVIFGFGCGVAMVLGAAFLIVIQLPCILHLIVWGMAISVDAGLVLAGYYTKGLSATWETSGRPGNEALALYYGSYALYGLAGLWLITIIYLRKRILLAISCVMEASRAMSAMPLMTLFPVLQVLCLFAFTMIWGVYMVYLASSGEISASCLCPDDYQSLPGFTSDNEETMIAPTPSPLENLESDRNMMCDAGCYMYKELTYSTNTKYAGL